MSSEVCPFCGKTFKRLKSHLPHCKAAPCVTTGQQDVAADRTSNAHTTLPQTKTRKTTKKSAGAAVGQPESDEWISPTPSSLLTASPETLAPAAKRSQKLDEHVKSTSSIAKPKKKSVRELFEATQSKQAAESLRESTTQIETKTSSKSAPKKKASKKASLGSPQAKRVESKSQEQKPLKRRNFWEDVEDLQPSGGAQEGRISLQGVKATLGRPSVRRPSSASTILSLADSNELHLEPKTEEPVTGAEQPLSSLTQRSSALRSDAPPLAPSPPPRAAGERHVTGTFTKSSPLGQISSPLRFPAALPVLPVSVALVATHRQPEGALAHRSLGMVKLRELPDWLAGKAPSHPRDVVDAVQRGWQWYYRRYIDVRKGGVAGVGMLVAGYCVLSYVWSYPHTKLDRWRKYH